MRHRKQGNPPWLKLRAGDVSGQRGDVIKHILPSDYHREMVRAARGGDVSAALDILRTICTSLETGKALPAPVGLYLHGALCARLNDGKPLDVALYLVNPAHRQAEIDGRVLVGVHRPRKVRTALGVKTAPVRTPSTRTRPKSYLVARIYLRMKIHGQRKGEALDWVARRYRISHETLRDYDRQLNRIRGWSIEQLKGQIRIAKSR